MNIELKPCPGCDGSDIRVIGGPGTKGGPQYWAGCAHCRWRTWGDTEAEAITAWNTRPAPTEAEVEAANWIRAWRNLFISERMNAYRNDPYETCRAKAEADANDFEEAFRERMARAALGVG